MTAEPPVRRVDAARASRRRTTPTPPNTERVQAADLGNGWSYRIERIAQPGGSATSSTWMRYQAEDGFEYSAGLIADTLEEAKANILKARQMVLEDYRAYYAEGEAATEDNPRQG